MVSLNLGISMLAHITIILAVKAKNFWDSKSKKNTLPHKSNPPNKVFTSLAIAIIMEFVVVLIVLSAFSILGASVISSKSNYKVLKEAVNDFDRKSISLECLFQTNCGYSPPDASIPVS
ncbi:MAG: hypothetical protein Q8Q48_02380 [Candidatus Staskawiczbacteria bacterium]|nr:hypothetical protein [Candidatus Staskawiczbacteria bacterium]